MAVVVVVVVMVAMVVMVVMMRIVSTLIYRSYRINGSRDFARRINNGDKRQQELFSLDKPTEHCVRSFVSFPAIYIIFTKYNHSKKEGINKSLRREII